MFLHSYTRRKYFNFRSPLYLYILEGPEYDLIDLENACRWVCMSFVCDSNFVDVLTYELIRKFYQTSYSDRPYHNLLILYLCVYCPTADTIIHCFSRFHKYVRANNNQHVICEWKMWQKLKNSISKSIYI